METFQSDEILTWVCPDLPELHCLDICATRRFLLSLNRQEIKHQEVGIRCQLLTFALHQTLCNVSKCLIHRWKGKKAPCKRGRLKGSNEEGTSE